MENQNAKSPAGVVVGEDGLARTPWGDATRMREYYDTEWGLPVADESGLFERMSLEAFQSGLSWATILAKRPAFRAAFAGFEADAVAEYGPEKVEELMQDAGIVRNLRKIEATIANARATVALRQDGGLAAFLWSFRPERTPLPATQEQVPSSSDESKALAKALKKRGFAFVGPTTAFALMEAIGMVDTHVLGSHRRGSSGLWAVDGTRAAEPPLA